jgi:peptidoglycan/xylan/chitin deacetylase (PgdA/CDA1 family)
VNFTWRDYGNRVGVWGLIEALDEYQIPVTALLNTEIYEHCPQIAAALRARKAEFVGHGRTNGERQRDLSEDAERALIERSCDLIARHEGTPPAGWLGPWLSETLVSGGESMGRALAILALRLGDERFPVNLHFGADAARLRQLIAANEEQLAMLERDDTGGHQRTQLTLRGFRPQPGARTRAGPSIRRRGAQRTASRYDRSDY